MSRLRVAVVGCGRIAPTHFDAIGKLGGDLELVAACDVVERRARDAAAKHGVAAYVDCVKMLECERPDLVSICTPSGLHPQIGIVAARSGVNVISEKPLGCSLAAVDEFIRTCDENNVRLFCVKQNRFNVTAQLLKSAVDKGRFGRIYLGQVNVLWRREQSYYDGDAWRGTWDMDGGAFMNQACHLIDLLCWFLGDVAAVTATTGTLARDIEAEDTGSAVLEFKSGAIASVNVTMLAYPRDLEGSVAILGEHGTVKLGGIAANRVEQWDFAQADADDALIADADYTPPNVYGFGHVAYYHHVVQVMKGLAEPNPDGRGGRKSLETILAIYQSSREGTRVELPIEG